MIKVNNLELISLAAAGTLNFFGPGHGWWYHKFLKLRYPFSFNYSELSSWISKTTPFDYRAGNMEINEITLQPKKWFPDCVIRDTDEGIMLNAVGISSPGLPNLLERERWQGLTCPFGISIIAIGETPEERIREIKKIAILLKAHLPSLGNKIFIEEDFSCPNVRYKVPLSKKELLRHLYELRKIGVPVSAKLNALTAIEIIKAIEESGFCDWLSLGNTIPFGKLSGELPGQINWKKFFGTTEKDLSPLAHYGGGGISGWPLVDVYCNYIRNLRVAGITMPILGGGGIGCRNLEWLYKEIQAYYYAGANALQLASIFALKPNLVAPAIRIINQTFC